MLLALDTSTSTASVALVDGERTRAELCWEVGQRHSTELLQRLDWLFDTQKITPAQLDGVAVATGPGSFNGVRVAVSTAKSLAFALRTPLYAVPTLDVLGWGCHLAQGPVWAVLEAGRGEVYAAPYATPTEDAAGWAPLADYAVLAPSELAGQMSEPCVVCGEWRPETRAALEDALGDRVRFASRRELRRATWLAELAFAREALGQRDDPAAVEPLYLRRPAITTSTRAGRSPVSDGQSQREDAQPDGEGTSHALHR